MIHNYSDHAANERTYLAWVRTGIAVIAFGFVIEKFNVFLATIGSSSLEAAAPRQLVERLSMPFGRYAGVTLIAGGIAIVVLATARFIRTTRLLDDPQQHFAKSVRAELFLSAALVLLVTSYGIYLALG